MAKKTFLTNEDKAELEGKLAAKAEKKDIKEFKFSDSCVLLWENASPTSAFEEQTIVLDLSAYGFAYVEFANEDHETVCLFKVGSSTRAIHVNSPSGEGTLYHRKIEAYSDRVIFSVAGSFNLASGANKTNNTYMIPLKIYGIK